MNNKGVFVTGGTGLVGSYLLRLLLQRGYRVRALRRATSTMELVADIEDRVEWVEGDILDVPCLEACMQGIDYVYHSAAMILFHPSKAHQMFRVNVEGTANVVNTALHCGVKKLLHLSSIAALGRKEFQTDIDETVSWENSKENSNYAITKFKAECEVWRGIEEGLNAVIVNPSVILGAGYWGKGSSRLFDKIGKGLTYYTNGKTGFVDVRDVARLSVLLMEGDWSAERFILNAKNLTYKTFFELAAKAMQKKPPSRLAPNWLLQFLWRLEWLRAKFFGSTPLVTRETVRSLQSSYYYHNEKVKEALGYSFIPIEETIKTVGEKYIESQQNDTVCGTPMAF